MTQEDKDLLLKDLCARLPYKTLINIDGNRYRMEEVCNAVIGIDTYKTTVDDCNIEQVKPYLFPLSSITEEQRNDISKLLIDTQKEFPPYGELNIKGCDNLFVCTVKQANALINYCLTHHLDINGLIPKELAIDATGLNIY